MGLQEILSRFNRLKQLIQDQQTGSPDDLAEELGLSKRQLLNYVNALKNESEDQIIYDRTIKSYRFLNGDEEKTAHL
ncbi:hypothetical protein C900_02103 [Fulvivirga imtechensis AK7]|uniref:Helix-turn-helix type 11 domain-containing protein n=1 Tax=Fulvivirga imtechensis AK7 TaxID=1237149 RepID=L8K1A0_9BACT|nr:hypothetical protein C900_02103 [Fulvivirga imtechensis AK7]